MHLVDQNRCIKERKTDKWTHKWTRRRANNETKQSTLLCYVHLRQQHVHLTRHAASHRMHTKPVKPRFQVPCIAQTQVYGVHYSSHFSRHNAKAAQDLHIASSDITTCQFWQVKQSSTSPWQPWCSEVAPNHTRASNGWVAAGRSYEHHVI